MADKVVFSPLYYIGSKRWLVRKLVATLPEDTTEIVSPFFGGGSLELNLALRGVRVHGYEKFQPVVNYWQHWLHSPSKVIADANATLNLYSHAELQRLKKQRYPEICYHGEMGASLYYVFNRLSFVGSPSNHVRDFRLRFDGHYIRDWKDRKNGRRVFPRTEFWEACPPLPISVEHNDFKESLAKHPDIFAFLDPPYPNLSSRLYGDSREYHQDFDHLGLYDILKSRKNWGLCYNDVPFVRDLYSEFQMIEVKRPGDSWGKNKDELLILSDDIAEESIRTIEGRM